ncbi:PREDICTED: zinc finger CCCH domain-containing protein 32-like [Nicotiana attenuata]|uniref:Zinc finger ccch domain-containing protein 32 n=1 Tax=Nicotiana attenuata TaxID=49451 RepID=A0A1J6IAT8_NICAT|nr:PREDICTED: zinc finger CCCH domain-containing protein 32-like [Nicotiana attenuata]OIT01556.1 zinc finger ccch domain-containing protein 32 [Nicotiana attenuata]
MEEELLKRNTDCVYFLASPLTCKKGIECEYRHSEIARLNPRDCWYWLAGSCLNPTCAFRHPPLESRAETSSESAPPHNKSAVPVNKTNVPCYFYFNSYCNKGERCSFLHGPDDSTTAWKSSIIVSGVPDGPTAEKKTSAGSETGPASVEKPSNSSETGSKAAAREYIKSKVDLHLMTNDVGEQIASYETSGSPSEEATAVRLDSLVPAEGFTQGGSDLSPDRSSDEEVEDNVEREEWLESSPGFDVLVDDRIEGLSHEDDHSYLLQHDMEDREFDERFAGFDFENNLEYDPAYPDMRIVSEELDDSYYDNVENHEINEYVREIVVPAHGRHSVPHKRKLPRELAYRGGGNVDLRDLLKKRRVIESDPPNYLSRRLDLSRLNAREQRRDRHRPQGSRWMPHRLASKVETNASFSSFEDDTVLESSNHLKKLRQSQGSSYRHQHFKDRRRGRSRPFANEAPRRMASRQRLTEVPKIFGGPKTLAQIRAEKRKGREDGNSFERIVPSGGSEREDFSGPKPLSEILKVKRRLDSVVTSNN